MVSSGKRKALVVKVDGIDGCGKTTLIQFLSQKFESKLKVLVTNEFGNKLDTTAHGISSGMSVSEVLKHLAKCPDCDVDDIERELLWAIASRRTNRIVLPKYINLYDLILVDRSNLGNLAYGIAIDESLAPIFSATTNNIEIADICFWLDTPVEVCQRRMLLRGGRDIIEMKGSQFFTRVRSEFERLVSADPRIHRLDGNESLEQLTEQAHSIISSLYQSTN